MRFHTSALLLALTAAPLASALGINCQGSSACSGSASNTAQAILNQMNAAVPDNYDFANGDQIVCAGGKNYICAFLQNVNGYKTGAQVKQYMQAIINHGCKVCGSDPTEPGNNVATGELTANYVVQARPIFGFG